MICVGRSFNGLAWLLIALVSLSSSLLAAPPLPQGMAMLSIEIEGSKVEAHFHAPRATLVGFSGAARTAEERKTLGLARENLGEGAAMMRFDTQADCRQEAVDIRGDAVSGAGVAAEIRSEYRFVCRRPDRLDSLALGFFIGFPALERVLVRYSIPEGRGGAELTQGHPVLDFVPF